MSFNQDVRCHLAAELCAVIDSYVSPDTRHAEGAAVLQALERSIAHALDALFDLQAVPDCAVATVVDSFADGVANHIAAIRAGRSG